MKRCVTVFLSVMMISSCATVEQENQNLVSDVFKSINGEPVVPRTANRIFLAKIKNWTGNGLLGGKMTIKIKDAINIDGRLAVVPEEERADLLLEVTLKEYMIQNIGFDGVGQPVQKRMKIVAGAMLVNLSKKKVIFNDHMIQAFAVYSEFVPPIKMESAVMEEVADNLVNRITAKTLSGWYTQYMSPAEKGEQ